MTTRRVVACLTAVAVVVAASLSGCGSADSSGSPTPTTTTTPTAAMKRLAARYAHYDIVAYDSTDLKNLIISFGFTDLYVKDGELRAQESFCHADQVTDQPIQTFISDAATSAIKPVSTAVTLSTKDGQVQIHRPETPTGIGIRLEDPANEKLPTDPKDPRIADDDRDGKPGITVRVEAGTGLLGELYIARRERFAYDVTEQADRSLTGTVTDKSEQLIVGATNDLLLTKSEWTQHPDLSKSPIILKPVNANWDCKKLMASAKDLFPAQPTVDW